MIKADREVIEIDLRADTAHVCGDLGNIGHVANVDDLLTGQYQHRSALSAP